MKRKKADLLIIFVCGKCGNRQEHQKGTVQGKPHRCKKCKSNNLWGQK